MADEGLILIADDEETVLQTTAALLSEEGFVCHLARNATEALGLIARNRYNVILTDWKMPGNTELEFVEALEKSGNTTSIVLVTGYPQLAEAIEARGLVVFAEVIKPFEFEELLAVVRQAVIHSHRMRSATP